MDPNVLLDVIRGLVKSIDQAEEDVDRASLGDELASHVENLDEWLSKGGFLPEHWKRIGAMGSNS